MPLKKGNNVEKSILEKTKDSALRLAEQLLTFPLLNFGVDWSLNDTSDLVGLLQKLAGIDGHRAEKAKEKARKDCFGCVWGTRSGKCINPFGCLSMKLTTNLNLQINDDFPKKLYNRAAKDQFFAELKALHEKYNLIELSFDTAIDEPAKIEKFAHITPAHEGKLDNLSEWSGNVTEWLDSAGNKLNEIIDRINDETN